MAVLLLFCGAGLIVSGLALIGLIPALIGGGALLLLAGADMTRTVPQ